MQVDRDIKVLIKSVLHESRSATAWGKTNDRLPLASLSSVFKVAVQDADRGLVRKVKGGIAAAPLL